MYRGTTMKRIVLVTFMLLMVGVTFTQERPRLAVVKFMANDAIRTQEIASTVRNLIESSIVASGEYDVMTREEIDLLLENQQIQLNPISSDENLQKLQSQNMSYLVIGTIDFIDDTCIVTIKMLDVKTGIFTNSVSEIMKNNAYALFEGTATLATNLIAGLTVVGDSIEKAVTASGAYKIGDTGPGGGLIFFVEGNTYLECSSNLGEADWNDAKTLAKNYRGGGYDDWYLPTKRELNYIYENLRTRDFIWDEGWLWSSSVYDDTFAWNQLFSDGRQDYNFRTRSLGVRAIRAFNSSSL